MIIETATAIHVRDFLANTGLQATSYSFKKTPERRIHLRTRKDAAFCISLKLTVLFHPHKLPVKGDVLLGDGLPAELLLNGLATCLAQAVG